MRNFVFCSWISTVTRRVVYGRALKCGFLTLSIFHGFSMVAQPLVVVLGRAGVQPLKLYHVELWLFSTDFPRLLHLWYMGMYWSADFLLLSTDFSTVTQPLVVVLGRAGLQPLKLCHAELCPRIFHCQYTCGIWACRFTTFEIVSSGTLSADIPRSLHLWYMGVHPFH